MPVEEEVRKRGMAQGYAKALKHRALMEKKQNGIKRREGLLFTLLQNLTPAYKLYIINQFSKQNVCPILYSFYLLYFTLSFLFIINFAF
jgi:hypothetical protein